MNVKFLNPFVSAAFDVFSMELHEAVERGNLLLEDDLYVTDDVTVVLSHR
jgi:CheY-specific phosphatase CheX